jgi:hypothetical protein
MMVRHTQPVSLHTNIHSMDHFATKTARRETSHKDTIIHNFRSAKYYKHFKTLL